MSHPAAEYGRQHGITVIEGGCPCMFGPAADPGHKVMRLVLTMSGNVPRRVLLNDPEPDEPGEPC